MQKSALVSLMVSLMLSLPSLGNPKVPTKPVDIAKPSDVKHPPAVVTPKTAPQNKTLPNTPDVKALPPTPIANQNKIAEAIQKHYNETRSATFSFEQTYVHPFLSARESSKGNVSYNKASGSMMWNYVEPKNRQKKFFINGNKFTYYSVSDKIAYTHDCYDKDTLSASVTFLLGTGNLKASFDILPYEGDVSNKSLNWLTLIPKEENAPVKKISFGASSDGKVLESIVEDPSGGKNQFKFLDFKTNAKIENSVFNFKAPPGVITQPMPNVECSIKQTNPAADVKVIAEPKNIDNKINPAQNNKTPTPQKNVVGIPKKVTTPDQKATNAAQKPASETKPLDTKKIAPTKTMPEENKVEKGRPPKKN